MSDINTESLRLATLDDIPYLLELAKTLYETSGWDMIPVDYTKGRAMFEKFIVEGQKDALVLISHDNGKAVGVLAAYSFVPLFSNSKVAVEVLWYLDPAYRGRRGVDMKKAYEYWAKLVGAEFCQYGVLSTSPDGLEKLYQREGMKFSEKVYMKKLEN